MYLTLTGCSITSRLSTMLASTAWRWSCGSGLATNVIVESSGRFFLWNETTDFVCPIDKPATNVGEILKRLGAAPDWD
jgi:hypothetical protein